MKCAYSTRNCSICASNFRCPIYLGIQEFFEWLESYYIKPETPDGIDKEYALRKKEVYG